MQFNDVNINSMTRSFSITNDFVRTSVIFFRLSPVIISYRAQRLISPEASSCSMDITKSVCFFFVRSSTYILTCHKDLLMRLLRRGDVFEDIKRRKKEKRKVDYICRDATVTKFPSLE